MPREPAEPRSERSPSSPVCSGSNLNLPSLAGRRFSPTSLDPDETTVGFDLTTFDPASRKKIASLAVDFRHSFWAIKRLRVYDALRSVVHAGRAEAPKVKNSSVHNFLRGGAEILEGLDSDSLEEIHRFLRSELDADTELNEDDGRPDRLLRYARCGHQAFVIGTSEDPPRYRVISNKCHDRFCDACSRDRRMVLCRNIADRVEDKNLRLLTLTLKSSDDPLGYQLTRLYKCFRMFRQRRKIMKCMDGGLFFCELTLNDRTDLWHPHLHILFEGAYLPQKTAANVWREVTGDSYIVDIRKVSDAKAAARYVAKYASKALSSRVWRNSVRLQEAIVSLHGRRTFQTFGSWTKLELSKTPSDDAAWNIIEPLGSLLLRALRGDEDALVIRAFIMHEPTDTLPPDT